MMLVLRRGGGGGWGGGGGGGGWDSQSGPPYSSLSYPSNACDHTPLPPNSESGKLPKLLCKSSSKSCASRRSGSSAGGGETEPHLETLKILNSRWSRSNKHDFTSAIRRVKEKHGEGVLSE